MIKWGYTKRDGKWILEAFENGKKVKTISFDKQNIFGSDGLKSNNWISLNSVQSEHLRKAMLKYLQTGVMPGAGDLNLDSKQYKTILEDMNTLLSSNGINTATYDPANSLNLSLEEQKAKALEEETALNPYAAYMEKKRVEQEGAEKGLLEGQTNAARQNADILAQQTMQQQSMFRDQLVEQIKSDRMSKMRSGISPMQIAQENLQFMVGNMQNNNQQVGLANQGQLAAAQQAKINPYQAYINSQAATTGGQGYGAVASGFAATDAGDLDMQTQRVLKSNPGLTYQQALALVKGT